MSSGGGDGGAGARQEEEERRKAEMRRRIDRLYGINRPEPPLPRPTSDGWLGPVFRNMADQQNPQIEAGNSALLQQATEAAKQMETENTKLGEATRSYYTDELGDKYAEAERNTRFKLARQGQLGGSEEIFQQGDVKKDRDLGATRVDESVRRAIASLTGQRENERLNAVNLVNAGAGDSAIGAAAAGLRNSFANAESAQKANIFTDLFANSADTVAASNNADQQAALLARYRDRLSSFFPAGGTTTSGRVTPSS